MLAGALACANRARTTASEGDRLWGQPVLGANGVRGGIQVPGATGDNKSSSSKSGLKDRVNNDVIFRSHQWRNRRNYSGIAGATCRSGRDSCAKQSTAQSQGRRSAGYGRDIVEQQHAERSLAGAAVDRRGPIGPGDRSLAGYHGRGR
jgi:hypothetical protein